MNKFRKAGPTMLCETKTAIIDSLYERFKLYEISKQDITGFIDSAVKNGLSLSQAELGTRMSLCSHLKIEQYYGIEDIMTATGESREAALDLVEQTRRELIAQGRNPLEYFPTITFASIV